MKKKYMIIVFMILLIFIIAGWSFASDSNKQFGVFVGLNPDGIEKLTKYKEIVIDAQYFSKSNLNYLHSKGVRVYSYLNIGSIEKFRPYYKDFVDITLGSYENWPDERWIDISKSSWQDHVVNTTAKELSEKGVDGFFIDNVDVYSVYKNDKIFNGVKSTLEKLRSKYQKPVIVNGGYDFFTQCISNKFDLQKLADGVNIESVYTDIDFNKNILVRNNASDREDEINYLSDLKAHGLGVYVIEYSNDRLLNIIISLRYKKLGFKYYISDNIELK